MHPFSGWSSSGGGKGNENTPATTSIYGALPYPLSAAIPSSVEFHFNQLNLLNSTVIGPHSRPCFHVITNEGFPSKTILYNSDGGVSTTIEWVKNPTVEVQSTVPKREVREWLVISPNGRYALTIHILKSQIDRPPCSFRSMIVQGRRFIWRPASTKISVRSSFILGIFSLIFP